MATSAGLEVLVVGGGIGGLCLAQGLIKAGVTVRVYERDGAAGTRLDRYRLHISPAGSRALRACLPQPSWERLLAGAGQSGDGFGFLTEQLGTLVVVDDHVMYPETTEPAEQPHPLDRAFLHSVLLDGLEKTVSFDRNFVRYELAGERVTACFADGTSAEGDVLVGADGVHSQTRRQYLQAGEPAPTGAVGVGWTVPLDPGTRAWLPQRLAAGMNMIMTAAPFFLFTSVFRRQRTGTAAGDGGSGDYLLCAFVARQAVCPAGIDTMDSPQLARFVSGRMTGWHPSLVRLATEADPATFGAYPFVATPTPPIWATTRVTLLGDAVHPMPPAGGNGANTALRDGHLLARQLIAAGRGQQPLLDAIGGYETDMRDYAFAAVRAALTNQRQGLNASPFAQAGMRAWFRLCAAVPAIKRAGFANTWAKDARPRSWEQQSLPGHDAGTAP